MATTTEAPASSTAEGPTTHTQNQTPRFSPYQLRMLHGGINPARVRTLGKLSHLEAWDVRRQLTRIFGFGGYSIETLSLDLVHENRQDNFQKRNKQGEPYGNTYTAWTIVYRAQVRLTVFDTNGQEICHWEDGAAGDATNQPSVGDAHDMAMKTSLSQALKRCAVNLGDQFGLSLYDGGSRDAVVNFSAAHPPRSGSSSRLRSRSRLTRRCGRSPPRTRTTKTTPRPLPWPRPPLLRSPGRRQLEGTTSTRRTRLRTLRRSVPSTGMPKTTGRSRSTWPRSLTSVRRRPHSLPQRLLPTGRTRSTT